MLDALAARKLRFHHPELARQWDAIQQQQRKVALQKLQSGQTVDSSLGRTRSLSISSESYNFRGLGSELIENQWPLRTTFRENETTLIENRPRISSLEPH
jgi:hypothetical protein